MGNEKQLEVNMFVNEVTGEVILVRGAVNLDADAKGLHIRFANEPRTDVAKVSWDDVDTARKLVEKMDTAIAAAASTGNP